jgi:hypothetical protein
MFKTMSIRLSLALCLVYLALTGCDRQAEEGEPAPAGLLRYVPADTPYVFAMIEPLPDDIADKFEPKLDLLLMAYRDLLQAIVEASASAAVESEQPDEAAAIGAELAGLMSVEGLNGAGIDRNSTIVLYGAGLLPVMRMTLSDGDLFEAAIARIEEKANESMSTAMIGGQRYRFAGDDKARLIIAVIEDEIVLSIVPANVSDDILRTVLGLTLPATSIADSGELQEIFDDYGFERNSVGLIDVERIVATFLEDQTGVNAELLALMDYDRTQLTDVCWSEIREMSGVVPRVVTGYSEMTVDRFSSNTIIEVRSDIAAGLATLAAPVPGLGSDQSGLLAFGMSMDILAARRFYEARLDAIEADECDLFSELQAGVTSGRQALQQPIPPIVYELKGFLAVIEDIQGMDLANKRPPSSADIRFLLAADNAAGLLAMGAMFSPEIAALQVEPNGKPVRFESPQLAGVTDAAYVAMTESALAISVGKGTETRLADMLAATIRSPHPFMSMDMDADRYYDFIAQTIVIEDDGDDETPPELKKAIGDVMRVLGDMFSRITFKIEFTERGVEFPSAIIFSD